MNRESKLVVVLFSDANFLAVNILENLLSKNCVVKIISDDIKSWEGNTKHIPRSPRFSLIRKRDYKDVKGFHYALFCGGFIKKEQAYTDFQKFTSNKNFGSAKTIVVFPFEIFSLKSSSKLVVRNNEGIVYMGDLMGPRMDLNSNLLLPKLIKSMVTKRSITLGVGELFFPIFITDAGKTIVKWLLSFGPYGKETFFLGNRVSSTDFWKENLKSFPDLKIIYDTDVEPRFLPKGYDIQYINSNLNICLNETYKWILKERTNNVTNKLIIKEDKNIKTGKPYRLRTIRPFLLPLFLILFFPFITTLISVGILFLSYKQFLSDNIKSAQSSALLAKTIFVIGKSESEALGYIPVIGRIYKETSYVSETGATVSNLAVNSMPLLATSRQMLGTILGSGIYDVGAPSQQIKLGLDYIYSQISIFEIITKDKASQNILSAKQMLQIVDFDKLKILAQGGSFLGGNLPSLLGTETDKNYLILFQNNMELRPTGGFIGSYGIANFGGGKLNGLAINDIYSADGQLKGHVEPPAPIRKYLGEANWWFRDSNWDPDFPTSAERSEWFLNKEMYQQVDGVIAIDLEPIKNILNYTGPIFLPDYNLTITPENLYEKTQEESQANSFPGSRQKASFLTALSRSLLNEVTKMNSKERILVLKAFYESLTERHIQIYLHSESPAVALNNLGWDGRIKTYSCGDGCYSDFFGDVEANVGVNKSNYFVNRKYDFKVKVEPQTISRQLTIRLSNSANISLGASGIYKSYMRIMIPSDAKLLSAKAINGTIQEILSPEITQEKGRQEVGVMLEITPGQTEDIQFVWQNDVSKLPTSYGLFVRKQAGVGADPLAINFSGITPVLSQPAFALTGGGIYTYNTTLTKDLFTRISWKK